MQKKHTIKIIMENILKLKKLSILGSVRQRLGAENNDDETFDEEINEMSNSQIIATLCGWELGDENWWIDYKNKFDKLNDFDKDGTNR